MEHMDVPKHRFDGEDAKAADVAAILRVSIEEAAVRLDGPKALLKFRTKDVYSGSGSTTHSVGVGTTIYGRMSAMVTRKPKKKKRKRRRNSNDGSQSK
jgi:hypothetical protein